MEKVCNVVILISVLDLQSFSKLIGNLDINCNVKTLFPVHLDIQFLFIYLLVLRLYHIQVKEWVKLKQHYLDLQYFSKLI